LIAVTRDEKLDTSRSGRIGSHHFATASFATASIADGILF
jgi:hypothetical protein